MKENNMFTKAIRCLNMTKFADIIREHILLVIVISTFLIFKDAIDGLLYQKRFYCRVF